MPSASSMHEAAHPQTVLWDNPEGWGWGGRWEGFQDGGTHVYWWPIHADVWQNPSQHCEVIILQLT